MSRATITAAAACAAALLATACASDPTIEPFDEPEAKGAVSQSAL